MRQSAECGARDDVGEGDASRYRESERARMALHRSLSYPLLAEPRNTPAERKRRGCCAGRSSDGKVKFSPWPLKVTTEESDDDQRKERKTRETSYKYGQAATCSLPEKNARLKRRPTPSGRAGRKGGRGPLKRKFHFTLELEMKYLTTPPSLRTVNISLVSIFGQNWLRSFVARTSVRASEWLPAFRALPWRLVRRPDGRTDGRGRTPQTSLVGPSRHSACLCHSLAAASAVDFLDRRWSRSSLEFR